MVYRRRVSFNSGSNIASWDIEVLRLLLLFLFLNLDMVP